MGERQTPAKLGRYEILGEIATGGMAEVLLARIVGTQGFERVVAIKRILPHLAGGEQFTSMFQDEARLAARIHHPNVIQVHELSEGGGELFIVMEYLEGESLSALLKRLRKSDALLSPSLALYIVAEALKGLEAAHKLTDAEGLPLDLVHRDVSPQNIFVTYAGVIKLLDFGIAKAADTRSQTEAGEVKGKFAYMSPEQYEGKRLDCRSDLFAMGAVLYEALVSKLLFRRATDLLTIRAVCDDPIHPPSSLRSELKASVDAVCMGALARRRDERFASAAEMRRSVLEALGGSGGGLDLGSDLAALMRELFADRMAEKEEALRRARTANPALTSVPRADVDPIDLPPAIVNDAPTRISEPPPSRRRALPIWRTILLLATLAILGGLAWFVALRTERAVPFDTATLEPTTEPSVPLTTQSVTTPQTTPSLEVIATTSVAPTAENPRVAPPSSTRALPRPRPSATAPPRATIEPL